MRGVGSIVVLVAPALLAVGTVSGVVVQGERSWEHQVAVDAYDRAYSAAQHAHAAALDRREDVLLDRSRADAALADAAALAASPGLLDAALVAALAEPVDAVESFERGTPEPVPALPERVASASTEELRTAAGEIASWSARLADWADAVADDALPPSVATLREATLAAAGTARTAAQSVLDEHTAASEDSRAALASAIAVLGDVLDQGGPTAAAVGSVTSAAQAVKDSAAEAAAAAAAASAPGGGSGCPGGWCGPIITYEMAYEFCHMPPLMWQGPGFPEPTPIGPSFPCTLTGPGYSWTIYE